jgi:hypothetical protein
MSVPDLTSAIIQGINAGGEQFLEGTLAAVLPIVWLVLVGLHIGRPYILVMIDRFTLRLGADLLWLVYIALRDFMIISGVIMSFMFFFPDVATTDALPLTGGLAAVSLFGALLVKLIGDPDHNLRDYRLVSILIVIGAGFYFIPYLFGVQFNAVATGPLLAVSNFLVTNTNPNWAVAMAYVSVTLLAILGAIAAVYTIRGGGHPDNPATTTGD